MNNSPWVEAARLLGLGWYVVTAIGGGTVGGLLLDNWIDSSPLFTLLGLALGLVAAFWGIYRLIAPMLARSNKKKERD